MSTTTPSSSAKPSSWFSDALKNAPSRWFSDALNNAGTGFVKKEEDQETAIGGMKDAGKDLIQDEEVQEKLLKFIQKPEVVKAGRQALDARNQIDASTNVQIITVATCLIAAGACAAAGLIVADFFFPEKKK